MIGFLSFNHELALYCSVLTGKEMRLTLRLVRESLVDVHLKNRSQL